VVVKKGDKKKNKEGKGSTMMHAFVALSKKGTSWYKATLHSEETRTVTLAIVKLCLSEDISN